MSWQQRRPEHVASLSFLEERINMYISAMDTASAVNDSSQSSQLQRDIQKLVDLMERVGAGEEVMESQVPPPLAITPQIDVLPNALGELSARLADYHKALYFAEEELSEERITKIQGMQRALQAIHNLQKRAEAGFPIRADEVPPPVAIPSDDEFDNDAINTITRRLTQYQGALKTAEESESTDRRRITRIQSTLRTLEFLMTRAKAKRPVWKKDIPPEFEYHNVSPKGSPASMNKTKYLLVLRSLILRLSAPAFSESDVGETSTTTMKKLKTLEEELVKQKGAQPWLRDGNSLPELTKAVEKLEKLAAKKKESASDASQNLILLEARIREYTAAALKAKKDNQMTAAIKHFKVLKGLQALKDSLEKGETVDMTLVPPAPRDYTPTSESPVDEASASEQKKGSSHGETARLLPVNVRPVPETAEDKLAQKLTNYLDPSDNDDTGSPAAGSSQQNGIVNNVSKSTSSLLKKVQNSAVKLPAEKVLYGDPGFEGEGEKETLHNTKETDLTNHEVVQAINGNEGKKKDTEVDHTNTDNGLMAGNTAADIMKATASSNEGTFEENHEPTRKAENVTKETEKEPEKSESSPKSSPKSSGDIYSRKTLDSVGFLSCQTVPDAKHNLKNAAASDSYKPEEEGRLNSTSTSNIENAMLGAKQHIDKHSKHIPEFSTGKLEADKPVNSSVLVNKSRNEENETENQLISEDVAGLTSDPSAIQDQGGAEGASTLEHETSGPETEPSSKPLLNGLDLNHTHISSQDVPSIFLSKPPNSSTEVVDKVDIQAIAPQLNPVDQSKVPPVSTAISNSTTLDENQGVKQVQSEVSTKTAGFGSIGSITSSMNNRNKSTAEGGVSLVAMAIPTSCSSDELEFQDLMASMSASPVLSKATEGLKDKRNLGAAEEATAQEKSISDSISQLSILPKVESLASNSQKPSDSSHDVGKLATGDLSTMLKPNGNLLPLSSNSNGLPSSLTTDYSSEQPVMSFPISSHPGSDVMTSSAKYRRGSQPDVVFTCLENLKYDLLVEKSKSENINSEEVWKLETRMDQIKTKLRHSGRLIWELYKTCVETELSSIMKEIGAFKGLPQDESFVTLQHKQQIAKRELKLLQERLPKLSY